MDLDKYMIPAEEAINKGIIFLGATGLSLAALLAHTVIKNKQLEKEFDRKLKEKLPNDLDTATNHQLAEAIVRDLRNSGVKVLGNDDSQCKYQIDQYHSMFSDITEYTVGKAIALCLDSSSKEPTFCTWIDIDNINPPIRCKLVSDKRSVVIANFKKRFAKV